MLSATPRHAMRHVAERGVIASERDMKQQEERIYWQNCDDAAKMIRL